MGQESEGWARKDCRCAKAVGGPEWRRLGDVRVFHSALAGCIIMSNMRVLDVGWIEYERRHIGC